MLQASWGRSDNNSRNKIQQPTYKCYFWAQCMTTKLHNLNTNIGPKSVLNFINLLWTSATGDLHQLPGGADDGDAPEGAPQGVGRWAEKVKYQFKLNDNSRLTILEGKTSCWLGSDGSCSWWAATVATYCPSRNFQNHVNGRSLPFACIILYLHHKYSW